MAKILQISGHGTNRQTETNYSYNVSAILATSDRPVSEFKGIIQYTNGTKTSVYGSITGEKISFIETKKGKSSTHVTSMIHDLMFYNDNHAMGVVNTYSSEAFAKQNNYPVAMETVTVSKKYIQDEEYVKSLKAEITYVEKSL